MDKSSDNTLVEKAICEKTENDPVMQEFLMTIFQIEKRTSQFKKPYNEALDKAVASLEV